MKDLRLEAESDETGAQPNLDDPSLHDFEDWKAYSMDW